MFISLYLFKNIFDWKDNSMTERHLKNKKFMILTKYTFYIKFCYVKTWLIIYHYLLSIFRKEKKKLNILAFKVPKNDIDARVYKNIVYTNMIIKQFPFHRLCIQKRKKYIKMIFFFPWKRKGKMGLAIWNQIFYQNN